MPADGHRIPDRGELDHTGGQLIPAGEATELPAGEG
jgi:hypothetical protein